MNRQDSSRASRMAHITDVAAPASIAPSASASAYVSAPETQQTTPPPDFLLSRGLPSKRPTNASSFNKRQDRQYKAARSIKPAKVSNALDPVRMMWVGLSVFLAALLVLVQPALPGAFRLDPTESTEAQAMTGSTDYNSLFKVAGVATMGADGTLSCGDMNRHSLTTSNSSHFWGTGGELTSKKSISFLHDWEIRATAHFPKLAYTSAYAWMNSTFQIVLPASDKYIELLYGNTGSGNYYEIASRKLSDLSLIRSIKIEYPGSNPSVAIIYDSGNDRLTFKVGSYSNYIGGMKKASSNQTVKLRSNINWREKSHSDTSTNPPNMSPMRFTFNSMTIPHLDPDIKSLNVYPYNGTTPYGRNDMVANGSIVRVECVVRTTNANAAGEQFPLHLRTVLNNSSYPTQGITPFANSSYPVKVENGSTTNTYTSQGADGTPVTINGTGDCKVTYYATVNRAQGQAIKLSQCLTEDSFQGTYYKTIELFSEQRLIEGTAAGTHYSRGPKANANGWNNAPVTLTFNPGTPFDSLIVKDASGVTRTLNSSNPAWTITDTDGISLTYQAQSSAYSANTTIAADTVRVDTHAPTLAYDKASNTLMANDVPEDSTHATSGVWKIIREGKQDQTTCAAADGRVYGKQNGVWAATREYSPLPGTYVAVDAAGNVSGTVEVPAFGAPSVVRPEGAPSDPGEGGGSGDGDGSGSGDGSGDSGAYTGPVLKGPLDASTVTNPSTGLQQTTVSETWFELVDGSADAGDLPLGGTLDSNIARQVIERNYSFASPASDDGTDIPLVTDIKLIDKATGKVLTSIPTNRTSQTIIQADVTDPQGNKATVNLLYQIANKDDLPQVTPKPGTPDPKDVFGELIVKGNEKDPAPLEVKGIGFVPETEKLVGHADASVSITVQNAEATPDDIARMISNRYEVGSLVGAIGENGEGLTKGGVTLFDSEGNEVEGIDLSKPGRYTAVQAFTDKAGNTTVLSVEIACRRHPAPAAPEEGPSVTIDPSTDIRIDPDKAGTVDDTPYFEHDPDNPVNILDAIQVKPEGEDDGWASIIGGSDGGSGNGNDNGDSNGSGSGNGPDSTNPDGSGGGNGSGSGGSTPDQLPGNVQVTVTDETGRPVDPTNITEPGTYEVTISVKDPETDQFVVVDTLTFHVVDTSITDTDYIYKDVHRDHWGHGYIFDIGPKVINGCFNPSDVALGYMAGYAGTTDFGPANSIIRGDAAIVVWRMAGCPEVEGDGNGQSSPKPLSLTNTYYTGFTDCDAAPEMYYNKAISWCAANGIVEGYGDTGEYRPQNLITREEFASIIARYAGFKGKDTSASANADLTQYPDIQDVSVWALPSMRYVVAGGIMTGKGTDEGTALGTHGILDPQANVTRAEVAKMAYIEQPTRL